MGYEVPEAGATIVLDDPPYAGAEIEVRLDVTPALYFGLQQWTRQATSSATAEGAEAAMRQTAELFAEHGLIGWNLERGGQAIPANLDGVQSLAMPLLLSIVAAWLQAIGKAARPLPEPSTDGSPSRVTPTSPPPASIASSSTAGSSPMTWTVLTSAGSTPSSD